MYRVVCDTASLLFFTRLKILTMFGKNKNTASPSHASKVFYALLVVVLVGAVWMLADQKNTLKQVIGGFQRSITVDQQLDYQCRDLESEVGIDRCENAINMVAEALEDHQSQLNAAR